VFDSATAESLAAAGTPVVLVRRETSPEDVKGMWRAAGVLTALGGMTSHAAVVARGWGRPAVTGCSELQIDEAGRSARLGGATIREGDVISLNGATGEVIGGAVAVAAPALKGDVARFMAWVDGYRRLRVLANADTPADAEQVRAATTPAAMSARPLPAQCPAW
jgi:pyruvate, orthophosphate dikinase